MDWKITAGVCLLVAVAAGGGWYLAERTTANSVGHASPGAMAANPESFMPEFKVYADRLAAAISTVSRSDPASSDLEESQTATVLSLDVVRTESLVHPVTFNAIFKVTAKVEARDGSYLKIRYERWTTSFARTPKNTWHSTGGTKHVLDETAIGPGLSATDIGRDTPLEEGWADSRVPQ